MSSGESEQPSHDSSRSSHLPLVEVNHIDMSTTTTEAFQIHVECQKRPCLLENLVGKLENTSLLLLETQINVHDEIIQLDAIGITQEGEPLANFDTNMLTRELLDIINSSNANGG